MLKNNKGITLASLVVTIIVLLIIASVATVSCMGAVNYIKFNNAKAQFQTMQAQVNSWYEEYKSIDDKETWLDNYGEELTKADSTILEKMKTDLPEYDLKADTTGYKYFSADYIKNDLDIDGISYDFLINIKEKSVLLFGGITYQDYTYYSAEDFGIDIIKYKEMSGDITFDTAVRDGYIIVYNIQFAEDINISQYSVQYRLDEEEYWTTLTSDMKRQYTYKIENEDGKIEKITDSNAWYINVPETNSIPYILGEKYQVKIVTLSDQVSSNEVNVRSLSWIGVVMKSTTILKDDNEEEIVIPQGFYITSDSATIVKKGVVVSAPDGSEFVWVPVEEVSTMATKIGGKDDNGRINYQGKLYEFSSTGVTEMTDYGQGTISYREPSLVTGNSDETYAVLETVTGTSYDASSKYYSDILGYSSALEFGKEMQEEYNEMIESVEKYGGFYVGRYETSLREEADENEEIINLAQSISGVTSTTAADSGSYLWYGLYKVEKEYSERNGLTNIVGSSMIWGSQYDQMMIWMQSNGINVTSNFPTNLEGIKTSGNKTRVTGSVDTDKLSNIYDLLGNSYEWTIESWDTARRVNRGSYYNSSLKLCHRGEQYMHVAAADRSSRISLYVH